MASGTLSCTFLESSAKHIEKIWRDFQVRQEKWPSGMGTIAKPPPEYGPIGLQQSHGGETQAISQSNQDPRKLVLRDLPEPLGVKPQGLEFHDHGLPFDLSRQSLEVMVTRIGEGSGKVHGPVAGRIPAQGRSSRRTADQRSLAQGVGACPGQKGERLEQGAYGQGSPVSSAIPAKQGTPSAWIHGQHKPRPASK
jgi:hypothetical protein